MPTSSFKDYLIECAATYRPLLNPDQEKDLARRMRDESLEEDERQEARKQLIESNLRLVVYVAKNYTSKFLTIEDLAMEGNVGLITAVDKFDPEMGNRFSTCAIPWIKQSIMKAITEKGKSVRLPANVYQQLNNMKKAENVFIEAGIENPTAEQVAEKMGVEPERVVLLREWKKDVISLNLPLGDDSEDTLEDLQADTHDESPVDYTNRQMDKEFVKSMLDDLPERTRTILKMRYGIHEEGDPEEFQNPHTLEEIGAHLDLTRERIRQIERQTLSELKVKYSKYDNQQYFATICLKNH